VSVVDVADAGGDFYQADDHSCGERDGLHDDWDEHDQMITWTSVVGSRIANPALSALFALYSASFEITS